MDAEVVKGKGVNPAERYLSKLATRSFLSLWSYPNVYREAGKELADLLVVCGNDIIIFQDKWSEFPTSVTVEVAWQRWLKNTVFSGAKQVWGAERHIRSKPSELFLDASAKNKLPIPLPDISEATFHLMVVTHGGSKACHDFFGGSGSFIFQNDIQGFENHELPFVIGDLDTGRTFVHVLDDTSLEVLMRTLDTVTDFKNYLKKREALARSEITILSTGEEELLANYLKNLDPEGKEHDFNLSSGKGEKVDAAMIAEGGWEEFIKHPQRLAQIEQDKVSYFWDQLIEEFSRHAMQGTQYIHPELKPERSLTNTEKTLRFMALEPRYVRRALAKGLLEMVEITAPEQRRLRIANSHATPGLRYVFLLFPIPSDKEKFSQDDYRGMRAAYLEGCCLVTKLKFPETQHVVGIATESGMENGGRSEDAAYLDAREWTPELEKAAKDFHETFQVLVNPTETPVNVVEYPDVVSKEEFLKNPRNKPCPCGSGDKYKKCCLPKGRKFYKGK